MRRTLPLKETEGKKEEKVVAAPDFKILFV